MTRYALIAALLVVFAGGLYGKGRMDGKAALMARIEAAREADPVLVPQCLSVDRVRRLDALR
jgi:cytochrome oxidase assembly protein ShyY1